MEDEDKLANSSGKLHKTLDVAAVVSYPVGGYLGYRVAKASIHDEAVKNISHDGLLTKLQKTRETDSTKLWEETLRPDSRPKNVIAKELATIEKAFYDGRAELFEKMGVKTTREHWAHLRASEKFGAVIQGATVSSIIIGAVILMTQSKDIFKGLFDNDKDQSKNR